MDMDLAKRVVTIDLPEEEAAKLKDYSPLLVPFENILAMRPKKQAMVMERVRQSKGK
jgi:hypothetical protein